MKKKKSTNPQSQAKKTSQIKKAVKIGLIIIAVVIASASVYLGVSVFQQISGFSKEKLLNTESSTQISVETNKEYYSYARGGVRKNVKYEDIPQVMIDAVIAAEDSRFFEHNGFDLPRIVKALIGNIAAGDITAGGSTITQQVIKKSYYPKEEQTIQRKIGEVILSIEATQQTTKEEILELYLNKIYFGKGNKAIGIYAASKYYFDKEVQNLTLPEAALLAGTLNSPTAYDPFNNLDKAQKRRDTVLYLMYDHGYISEEEYKATIAIPVENTLKSNPIKTNGQYQAYADKVTREVYAKTGYDPEDTPMKIYTYIDTDVQEQLDKIAYEDGYSYYDDYIQAGASVQETQTGRIVGVLSGRDYEPMGTTYAYAAPKNSQRQYGQRNQPGSSLKPIISYAAAFEFLDYSTAHYVHDMPYSKGDYTPKNWDGKIHGDVSIKEALKSSWNLAAIQTFNEVITGEDFNGNKVGDGIGYSKMKEYLEGFGYDMYGEELGPQSAIGGWSTGVSAEEQAAAYAVIANGGTYNEPHTVQKIELLQTGEVIDFEKEYYQKSSHQALSEESAFMIRDIMTSYVKEGGSTYGALNLGYQIGAKSGTSNHSNDKSKLPNSKLAGESKDGWMVAFSPDYSWAVWTGYTAEVQKAGRWLRSNRDKTKIATIIAKTVHKGGLKNSYPSRPDGVVKATTISGIYPYVKPGDGVPSDRIVSGWFKKDNVPSGSASGASLSSLSSFTATLNNNILEVTFTPYEPKSMLEGSSPTITVNGKSVPYLGNISQIYGKVVYVVDITDSTGKVVHTEKLSTDKANIQYNFTPGTYTVTGYYAFENGSSTSNKINQTITIENTTVPASYTPGTPTSTSMTYQVTVPEGNKVQVSLNTGQVQEISTSSQVTFTNLTPGTSYTVSFAQITPDGQTLELTSHQFTTLTETTQTTE